MKPYVFVTRAIPEVGLERLRPACDLHVWQDPLPVPRDILLKEAAQAQGLLTLLSDPIDVALIDSSPRLQVISQYAVGYDNIDVEAATARGIPVGNTPDVLNEATADFAFTLLMATARRLVEGVEDVRSGAWKTWRPKKLLGRDIWGATLGIIGLGRIGKAMARRGLGFNMRVLYHDPTPNPEAEAELGVAYRTLDDLLAESDFVSIHCPLTPQTEGLIGADELERMKPTAILINTARGPVVKSDALVDALRTGQIAGAGLDVTEPEPLPADHPLAALPNCVVTPHIASASVTSRSRMAEVAADNLLAGLRGEQLPYCVNPQVYET